MDNSELFLFLQGLKTKDQDFYLKNCLGKVFVSLITAIKWRKKKGRKILKEGLFN